MRTWVSSKVEGGIKASTKEEKYRKIMESKMSTPVEVLCRGHPPVFASYLNYCRALHFEDRPDYAYLRRLFKDLFMREGFVNDGMFDWSQPRGQVTSSSRQDVNASSKAEGGTAAKGGGEGEGQAATANADADGGEDAGAGKAKGADGAGDDSPNGRGNAEGRSRQASGRNRQSSTDATRNSTSQRDKESKDKGLSSMPSGVESKEKGGSSTDTKGIDGQPKTGEASGEAPAALSQDEPPKKKAGFFASLFGCGSKSAAPKN
eukprot:gnl/TRDRNA2_/TRDRNA2_157731_c0_seq1.p1 gnl/TRDRNA2_/TRDRNA2_157731_c0~~gnl/TRDRNA2_/TRDRNA2_157731_c0_seq1.p1  ORF type:complete len:262 (+),score=57.38 gnl/TRDRNA2_/TRDRNA2_157731_c0_seq1:327-1112(+)